MKIAYNTYGLKRYQFVTPNGVFRYVYRYEVFQTGRFWWKGIIIYQGLGPGKCYYQDEYHALSRRGVRRKIAKKFKKLREQSNRYDRTFEEGMRKQVLARR